MSREPLQTAEIIKGCKNDDRKAQEQLYKYFYDSMIRLSLRYTKNEADAKVVLNTGFLRVFKNIHQYNPSKAALYTWVRSIILNCCLDYVKSKNTQLQPDELHHAEDVKAESAIETKIKIEQILYLIRKLPLATQAVFNLYVMDGYGHKDIAKKLQISEGTSKWHLSEARKSLKLLILQKQNDN